MAFYVGQLVRVTGTFKTAAGEALDPTAVGFKFRRGSGEVTTYVFGTNAQLVKDSVGVYHVDIDVEAAGEWWWRFYSTGTGQAAREGSFEVQRSKF